MKAKTSALADNIRNLRVAANMTQAELARRIGGNTSDISRLESGEHASVRLDKINAIAEVFSRSPGEIAFGGTDDLEIAVAYAERRGCPYETDVVETARYLAKRGTKLDLIGWEARLNQLASALKSATLGAAVAPNM